MTDNEIFENNLTHFQVVKKYQDRAQCKCPAHQDKQASLAVTKGRKCTLLYCHAGCQLDDILNAAGLEKRDIFYESTQNTANWRAFIEKRENNRIEAVYNYVSCNGQYAFTKVRLQGKHTALLKSLLGRDSITARFLHQREFEFIPKFKLVINTNYLPVITDDTIFSSGRLNVVSFDRHFEPHEQDKANIQMSI